MKTFIALAALLAVAVANPLPLVQIIVNVDAQGSTVDPVAIENPVEIQPTPVIVVDSPEAPEPVIVVENPHLPVPVPDPVILPTPVLPEVVPEPVVLPEPVLPEVVPEPVILPTPEVNPNPVIIPETPVHVPLPMELN